MTDRPTTIGTEANDAAEEHLWSLVHALGSRAESVEALDSVLNRLTALEAEVERLRNPRAADLLAALGLDVNDLGIAADACARLAGDEADGLRFGAAYQGLRAVLARLEEEREQPS
jgi:hypothetical protein